MTNERHEKALEAAEWIKHSDDAMPVSGNTVVDVRTEVGEEITDYAKFLDWRRGTYAKIVSYRARRSPNHFTNGE